METPTGPQEGLQPVERAGPPPPPQIPGRFESLIPPQPKIEEQPLDPKLEQFRGDIINLVDQGFFVEYGDGSTRIGIRDGAILGIDKAALDQAAERVRTHEGTLSDENVNFARESVQSGYQTLRQKLGDASARNPFNAQLFILAADVGNKVAKESIAITDLRKAVDKEIDKRINELNNLPDDKRRRII